MILEMSNNLHVLPNFYFSPWEHCLSPAPGPSVHVGMSCSGLPHQAQYFNERDVIRLPALQKQAMLSTSECDNGWLDVGILQELLQQSKDLDKFSSRGVPEKSSLCRGIGNSRKHHLNFSHFRGLEELHTEPCRDLKCFLLLKAIFICSRRAAPGTNDLCQPESSVLSSSKLRHPALTDSDLQMQKCHREQGRGPYSC